MCIYAVWVLLALSSPLAAQDPERKRPELAVLYQARRKMTEALDHLPNITCLALIDRSVRLSSKRRPVISDRIRLEVAFIGLTEMFACRPNASSCRRRTRRFLRRRSQQNRRNLSGGPRPVPLADAASGTAGSSTRGRFCRRSSIPPTAAACAMAQRPVAGAVG